MLHTRTVEPKIATLPVVEIFGPTVQGEGSQAGQRTMFVRLGYCDGAGDHWCNWCDSMFAVDPKNKIHWKQMTAQEIFNELGRLAYYCRHVTISGGNPALHDLTLLISGLKNWAYNINIETQGTVYRDWMQLCNSVTISPKPPSAGVCNLKRLWNVVNKLDPKRVTLKIPVDPDRDDDYTFARWVMDAHFHIPNRYLSVVTYPTDTERDILGRYERLIDKVCRDPDMSDVSVLPQIHVLVWGHKRGV